MNKAKFNKIIDQYNNVIFFLVLHYLHYNVNKIRKENHRYNQIDISLENNNHKINKTSNDNLATEEQTNPDNIDTPDTANTKQTPKKILTNTKSLHKVNSKTSKGTEDR